MAKRPTYRRKGSEIRRGRIGNWPPTGPTQGEYHGFPVGYHEAYPEDPQGKLKDCPRVTIHPN